MMKKVDDGLDANIRKLLDSLHGEEIDEKIEAKMEEMRAGLGRSGPDIAPLMAGLGEAKERLAKAEAGLAKLESAVKKSGNISEERLWAALAAEMDRLSSKMKEEAGRSRDMIGDLHSQVAGIRDMFREMREIHEEMKSAGVGGMARDIESLRQKVAWLEENSSRQEMEQLRERVEELERRISGMRLGTPMVIE